MPETYNLLEHRSRKKTLNRLMYQALVLYKILGHLIKVSCELVLFLAMHDFFPYLPKDLAEYFFSDAAIM